MSARWWLQGGTGDFRGRGRESSRSLWRSEALERPPALCPPRPSPEPGARDPASLRLSPWGARGDRRAGVQPGRGSRASAVGPAVEAGPGVVGGARLCLRPDAVSATRVSGACRVHLPGVGVLCLGRGAAGGVCAACVGRGCPADLALADKARRDRRPRRDYSPQESEC